jgi:hypothetical protein
MDRTTSWPPTAAADDLLDPARSEIEAAIELARAGVLMVTARIDPETES